MAMRKPKLKISISNDFALPQRENPSHAASSDRGVFEALRRLASFSSVCLSPSGKQTGGSAHGPNSSPSRLFRVPCDWQNNPVRSINQTYTVTADADGVFRRTPLHDIIVAFRSAKVARPALHTRRRPRCLLNTCVAPPRFSSTVERTRRR